MKRKDAFDKLHKICQRLEDVNPAEFPVIPLRLYLFGSLLTNKSHPADIDLLLQYQERTDLDPGEIVYALSYGKPLPHEKAIKYLRKGMQMIRIGILSAGSSLEIWLHDHAFDPQTPFKLIWEPGLNWKSAIQEVEMQPAAWYPEIERRNKYIQETARRIKEEQGEAAAMEWIQHFKNSATDESS